MVLGHLVGVEAGRVEPLGQLEALGELAADREPGVVDVVEDAEGDHAATPAPSGSRPAANSVGVTPAKARKSRFRCGWSA